MGPEIWALALEKIAESGEWQRRFGLVLLTHFARSANHRSEIEQVLTSLGEDRRHYVKKAITWVRRDLSKPLR
jgi:3-methyladenine DNA glycosylase AlkD